MASHSEVAHRWAQDDSEARTLTGFNMFTQWGDAYRGLFQDGSRENVIFSHGTHFPIAAFQTTPAGQRVVLANLAERRSISTTAHQREVQMAIPSRYPVFDVPNVSPRYSRGTTAEDFHAANVQALLERAANFDQLARRARVHKGWQQECALAALQTARDYAEAFGLAPVSTTLATLAADIAAREVAHREQIARERAERAKREAERTAALREEQAPAFKAWLAGEGWRVPSAYHQDANGAAYVRRKGDVLETSMGASVPWEHAVKAFRVIALMRSKGMAWARNGHTIRVGHYQIDRIDASGNMWAGCHYFAWEHMEALAKREGVRVVAEDSADVG